MFCLDSNFYFIHSASLFFPKQFAIRVSYPVDAYTNAADDVNFFFFFVCIFSEKIRLDISCESSARQAIHF